MTLIWVLKQWRLLRTARLVREEWLTLKVFGILVVGMGSRDISQFFAPGNTVTQRKSRWVCGGVK